MNVENNGSNTLVIRDARGGFSREMLGSYSMFLLAIHNVNGEEKLNLVMLDDAIPAGAKLY